ncbi:hypothetical protein TELCIR_02328 [Teladorsagia circumcincta]|uniref:Uncharacterized protein n=1 Tax=Teladorsagia circumcincta TaxID=45464 RepID=A0A2G9UZF6_TELCI|nr:hypothetical protein TELCIR_02328 [Teladorsagia circumcincta]
MATVDMAVAVLVAEWEEIWAAMVAATEAMEVVAWAAVVWEETMAVADMEEARMEVAATEVIWVVAEDVLEVDVEDNVATMIIRHFHRT